MIEPVKTKIYYICYTPYHLFYSIWLSDEEKKENTNVERVLVWVSTASTETPTTFLESYFDKIVRIENYETRDNRKRKSRFIKRCFYSGWLFPFTELGKLLNGTNGSKLYCYNDREYITGKLINEVSKRNGEVILVDEGLSTYGLGMGERLNWINKTVNLILGVKTGPYIGYHPGIHTLLLKHPQNLPDIKAKGRKIMKLPDIFLDTVWTSQFLNLCHIRCNGTALERGVLWLGQPLDGDGLNRQKELEWIKRIAGLLPPQVPLSIKPHPRERVSKYDDLREVENIQVIDLGEYSWIPGELIFTVWKPGIVLTAFSSAADFLLERDRSIKVIYCYEMMGINIDSALKNVLEGEGKYHVTAINQLEKLLADLVPGGE